VAGVLHYRAGNGCTIHSVLGLENGGSSMKYLVTVKTTILTEVEVDANSPSEARLYVKSYGSDLAAVDFPGNELYRSGNVVAVKQSNNISSK